MTAVQRETQRHMQVVDTHNSRQFIYLNVITYIVQKLAHFETQQSLLDYTVSALQEHLDFYISSIFWYDRVHDLAVLVAQDGHGEIPAPIGYTQSIQSGLLGRTMREKTAFIVDDVSHLPEYVSPQGYAPASSELCVPIFCNGDLWGAFNVESTLLQAFSAYDRLALELIAAQLGSAIYSLDMQATQQQMMQALTAHAEQQQVLLDQILELSTPVFPVYPGVLALPLIGSLDSSRMQHTLTMLLETIQQTQSSSIIIDITGVPVVACDAAQTLITLIESSNLLGASVILTGIRPKVAMVLAKQQAHFANVVIRNTFAAGLQYVLQSKGKHIV